MLQRGVQWFVDRLAVRFVPIVGAFFASALQRMMILGHAEHHNQMEEQARRYEDAGKPHLAAMIRQQAGNVSLDDPLQASPTVIENVSPEEARLTDGIGMTSLGLPETDASPSKPRRKKRAKKNDEVDADQNSNEGGNGCPLL